MAATAALANFNNPVNPTRAAKSRCLDAANADDDGSTHRDLAGYRTYFGRDQRNLTQVTVLNNPGLSATLPRISTRQMVLSMTSINSQGGESCSNHEQEISRAGIGRASAYPAHGIQSFSRQSPGSNARQCSSDFING